MQSSFLSRLHLSSLHPLLFYLTLFSFCLVSSSNFSSSFLLSLCIHLFLSLSSQSPVAFQVACGPEAFLPLKLKWTGTFSALPQKECWAMRCVPSSKWKWLCPVLKCTVSSVRACHLPRCSSKFPCTHGNAPFGNKNRAPCFYRMHGGALSAAWAKWLFFIFLRAENTLHIPLWNSSSMSPQTQSVKERILLYNDSRALNIMAP